MNDSDPSRATLTVGTRGSLLAKAQTQWVIDRLTEAHPGLGVRMEIITTRGDREQTRPLPEIGGKGLFTEELEQALRDGAIDLAVHSVKDLPTDVAEGLAVLAYPKRADARDAWISADGVPFDQLPADSVVGTGSLRRQAQLLRARPDLTFVQLRGNVDTRIRKVHEGQCAGAVLAMAGLERSGLTEHVTHPFEPSTMLPAPGQGALGLQGRVDDERARSILASIGDDATTIAVDCERAILNALDAGCRAPVAIYATIEAGQLKCEAIVIEPTGRRFVSAQAAASVGEPAKVVAEIVTALRKQGAGDIIESCRNG